MSDLQLGGDLRSRAPEGHEPHDLALAVGKRSGLRLGRDVAAEARSPARGAEGHEQDEPPAGHHLRVAAHWTETLLPSAQTRSASPVNWPAMSLAAHSSGEASGPPATKS